MRTTSLTMDMRPDERGCVIPGLHQTADQAIADIVEIENAQDENDWIPLDSVLSEIRMRHRLYES